MNYELPNAVEMEKFVLSALLLKKGEIVSEVAAILTADDFYRGEHKVIYEKILELHNEGIVPNLLSLIEKLHRAGVLEKMDLRAVMNLGDIAHTTAYVTEYAKVIKEKAILREMVYAGEEIKDNALKDISDFSDVLEKFNEKIDLIQRLITPPKSYNTRDYFNRGGEFETRQKNISKYYNRKTGFDNLDENQIFSPGLYVMGGVPAAGKTTFCWQLLEQLAAKDEKCVYASYEMSAFELFSKTISREYCSRYHRNNPANCDFSAADIRRGAFSQNLNDLMVSLEEFKEGRGDLTILEETNKDIDALLLDLRQFCKGGKAPVICIDYLQIIPHDKDSAKIAVDDIVRKLKGFQRETNATVIVISSFNRMNYTQAVSFESFKESGNIEYSADVVWGLQFEGVNDKESLETAKKQNPRYVQLRCLKNRQGSNYNCNFLYYPRSDWFVPCGNFLDVGSYSDENHAPRSY